MMSLLVRRLVLVAAFAVIILLMISAEVQAAGAALTGVPSNIKAQTLQLKKYSGAKFAFTPEANGNLSLYEDSGLGWQLPQFTWLQSGSFYPYGSMAWPGGWSFSGASGLAIGETGGGALLSSVTGSGALAINGDVMLGGGTGAAWESSIRTIEAGDYLTVYNGSGLAGLAGNLYFADAWRYRAAGKGAGLQFSRNLGEMNFVVAAAGAAGTVAAVASKLRVEANGNITVYGSVISAKACVTGYSRLGSNYCAATTTTASALASGVCQSVAAPATDARAVELLLEADVVGDGVVGSFKQSEVRASADSATCGVTYGKAHAVAVEFTAMNTWTLSKAANRVALPLSSLGSNYGLFLNGVIGSRTILGYYD